MPPSCWSWPRSVYWCRWASAPGFRISRLCAVRQFEANRYGLPSGLRDVLGKVVLFQVANDAPLWPVRLRIQSRILPNFSKVHCGYSSFVLGKLALVGWFRGANRFPVDCTEQQFSLDCADLSDSRLQHPSGFLPHIEGLRAIAVLPVLLFHLDPQFCPGGFTGVDVFFVISGYLICGGILRDLRRGTFSFGEFYHRRVRRILPAYFTLIVVVITAALILFDCKRVVNTSSTALFSLLFSTNLFLYQQSGDYFAPAAHENPLLNLWSLAVEEQFYILIPVLLLLLWKWRPGAIPWVAGILLAASFFYGLDLLATHRGSAAYYLPTSRAWELLAGALLAMVRIPMGARVGAWVSALGLGMIVAAFVVVDKTTPFPGYAALLPVLGAVFVIAGGQHGVVAAMLGQSVPRFFGAISYSLYLFHWPVIVFWKHCRWDGVGWMDYVGMATLSILLAWLCCRYVENPIRANPFWTGKSSARFTFATTPVLAMVAGGLVFGGGFPAFFNREINRAWAECGHASENWRFRTTPNRLPGIDLSALPPDSALAMGAKEKNPTFVLWGDSHAGALFSGLDDVARAAGQSGLYVNASPLPLEGMDVVGSGGLEPIADKTEAVLRFLEGNPALGTVFIANRWPVRATGSWYLGDHADAGLLLLHRRADARTAEPGDTTLFDDGLRRTCQRLRAAGKRVVLFTAVAEKKMHVPEALSRGALLSKVPDLTTTMEEFERRQGAAMKVLQAMAADGLAELIPLHEAFLREGVFVASSPGLVYYEDDDHLSPNGARHACGTFARKIFPARPEADQAL